MSDNTWSSVEEYFEQQLLPSDPVLEAALEASAAAGLPSIQVSASQGKLLHLLALTHGSRRNFARAGLAGRIELHVGPALDTLAQLRRDQTGSAGKRGSLPP